MEDKKINIKNSCAKSKWEIRRDEEARMRKEVVCKIYKILEESDLTIKESEKVLDIIKERLSSNKVSNSESLEDDVLHLFY